MKYYECPAVENELRRLLALAAEDMLAAETEIPIRQRLFVVMEELFNNTVMHAYKHAPSPGPVRIRFIADLDAVQLRMEDRGEPFNLLEFDDSQRIQNVMNLEEGGEGIFLIKTLSSSVEYARVNGWNRVDILIDKKNLQI